MNKLLLLFTVGVLGLTAPTASTCESFPESDAALSLSAHMQELKLVEGDKYPQDLGEGFTEIAPDFLTAKIKGRGIYFSLVPVTRENKFFWESFFCDVSELSKRFQDDRSAPKYVRYAGGGVVGAKKVFSNYDYISDPESQKLWMGVCSDAPLTLNEEGNLDESGLTINIRMVMTVSTQTGVPFAVHMGIFRNPLPWSWSIHQIHRRALSIVLHETVAKALTVYRKRQGDAPIEYLITSPEPTMRRILLKALPEGTISFDARREGFDAKEEERHQRYMEYLKSEDDGVYAEGSPILKTKIKEYISRFEVLTSEGVWTGTEKDAYWLVSNASNVDPYISIPYAVLADAIELEVKE